MSDTNIETTHEVKNKFNLFKVFNNLVGNNRAREGGSRGTTPGSPEGITRRKFLKVFGVTALVALEEAVIGAGAEILMSPLEKLLREKGILMEGNVGQFALTLRRLVNEYIRIPDEENKKLLLAWLKFNAAAHYAAHTDKQLASQLAWHFIYGEGKAMDITKLFEKQLDKTLNSTFRLEKQQDLGITEQSSVLDKTTVLFEQMMKEDLESDFILHNTWVSTSNDDSDKKSSSQGIFAQNAESDQEYFVGTPTEKLLGKQLTLFTSASLIASDTFFGLGHFTVAIEGVVSKVEDGTSLSVQSAKLKLFDTYDWDINKGLGVSDTLGTIINEWGLNDLFGNPLFDDLKKEEISLTDKEGVLLVERGYAHPFSISAEFYAQREVKIANSQLVRPPDDFMSSNNVNIEELQSK